MILSRARSCLTRSSRRSPSTGAFGRAPAHPIAPAPRARPRTASASRYVKRTRSPVVPSRVGGLRGTPSRRLTMARDDGGTNPTATCLAQSNLPRRALPSPTCLAVPCPATPCLALPCLALPCLALPRPTARLPAAPRRARPDQAPPRHARPCRACHTASTCARGLKTTSLACAGRTAHAMTQRSLLQLHRLIVH
jgi:hypothetical protein